jgi:hypothetical protein
MTPITTLTSLFLSSLCCFLSLTVSNGDLLPHPGQATASSEQPCPQTLHFPKPIEYLTSSAKENYPYPLITFDNVRSFPASESELPDNEYLNYSDRCV